MNAWREEAETREMPEAVERKILEETGAEAWEGEVQHAAASPTDAYPTVAGGGMAWEVPAWTEHRETFEAACPETVVGFPTAPWKKESWQRTELHGRDGRGGGTILGRP